MPYSEYSWQIYPGLGFLSLACIGGPAAQAQLSIAPTAAASLLRLLVVIIEFT